MWRAWLVAVRNQLRKCAKRNMRPEQGSIAVLLGQHLLYCVVAIG